MTQEQEGNRILSIKGLTFHYPDFDTPVINNLDFEFHKGERLGISAPNGSGKSTLFFLIMGLLKPTAGTISVFGKPAVTETDFVAVRKKIGLLLQDSDDQLFSPTVLEDVAFGPLNLGLTREDAIAVALETLRQLGLEGFEHRITHKLSGGERRLVSLATVLAMKPEALLLDEPSTGLDEGIRARLVELLAELNLPYIIISHSRTFLNDVTNTCYTMREGRLVPLEYGSPSCCL